jgi:hypothetical protein
MRVVVLLALVLLLIALLTLTAQAAPVRQNDSPLATPTYELTPPHRPTPTPGLPPWLITPEAHPYRLGSVIWLPIVHVR